MLPSVYRAGNISANVSSQLVPVQKTVNDVGQLSTQANQIGMTEKQVKCVLLLYSAFSKLLVKLDLVDLS